MPERGNTGLTRDRFESAYAGRAPWDISKPQSALQAAADKLAGSILDAGCGTGENALFFAGKGHAVTGVDFLEGPIIEAKSKAVERRLSATFLVKDALKLEECAERFDNVIDSGLFHVFSDADRSRYVRGLETVLKPGGHLLLLCFSDQVPGEVGPRRVKKQELREAFARGWEIESIELARFEVRPETKALFGGEAPKAWFMVARRAG
jgi:SAM-dependent methyltransferase